MWRFRLSWMLTALSWLFGLGLDIWASPGTVADFQAPGGGSLKLETQAGNRVKVYSPNWHLEFDLLNGGILDTIVFPHGSGKNLLLKPFHTTVGAWADCFAPSTDFRSSKEGQVLRLEFAGQMATPDRLPGPVQYQTIWMLTPFTVRVEHKLLFRQDFSSKSVGIGSFSVRPDLSEFGLRVGPADDSDPRMQAPARFGKVDQMGRTLVHEHHAPLYLLLFHRDLEGLDITLSSDLETWEKALTGSGGIGAFTVEVAADGSSIDVTRNALSSLLPLPIRKGEYSFGYYLGLPRIVEKSDRHWRHLSFGNHPWPSDADIQKWSESGTNIVRLHNDYAEDENFWHDGGWPPYDEKGMAELRRVISTCHRLKMKVVPYFSVHEFHPKAQGYPDHEQEWKRSTDQLGTVYHNSWGKGEFGAQMCPQSGWLERRKQDVERAYRELGFDGVYYDWVWGLPCNNKNHNPKLHLGTDEIVDLLAWTRRLISPNGTLILHLYGQFPSIALENYADLVVNMEEISDSEAMMQMGEIPVVTVLAESLHRSPCPSYRLDQSQERNRNNIAQLVLLGMFPWSDGAAGPVLDETLKLFRTFRSYSLEQYRFHGAYSGAVHTAWSDVFGALYSSEGEALVIISNTSRDTRKNVVWTVKPELLGFTSVPPHVLILDTTTRSEKRISSSALVDGSLETDLAGYEYRLFEVRPSP